MKRIRIVTKPQEVTWISSDGDTWKLLVKPLRFATLRSEAEQRGVSLNAIKDETGKVSTAATAMFAAIGRDHIAGIVSATDKDGAAITVDLDGVDVPVSDEAARDIILDEVMQALPTIAGLAALNLMAKLEADRKNAEPAPA